jgi:hypothetical protein
VGEEGPDLDGGQIGSESGAHCEIATETPLAEDEVSPGGFAPAEILALLALPYAGDLQWEAGGSTPLTFAVTPAASYAWVVQEVVVEDGDGSGTAAEIAPWCPSYLAIDVTLDFATADGAFAESFALEVRAESAEAASVGADLASVSGTFDVWDHVPAGSDYDEASASLSVQFDAAGPRGGISGQGSGVLGDPNDPDSVAYAENFEIAHFGSATEE